MHFKSIYLNLEKIDQDTNERVNVLSKVLNFLNLRSFFVIFFLHRDYSNLLFETKLLTCSQESISNT